MGLSTLAVVLLGISSAFASPPRALPNSQLDEAPVPADVESVEALDFETPQRDDIVTLDGSDEDMEPQVELLPERTMRKQSTTKVLKDSVLFSGPGFGFPLAAPAAPILAPRPALAVQPVVPIRAPPVPIVRTAFIPRIAPACPPFPPKPLDSDHCTWVPVKDNRHCVRQWECDPVPAPPIRCPRAPIKPEVGDRCNWIPILDKNNCIRKYECEPIPPEPCPPAPLPPDDHDQCKWVSIKDANGCIMDYECVPIRQQRASVVAGALAGDRNRVCCWWAMKGECDANLGWMRSNCARSCAAPGCSDGFVTGACIATMRSAGCPFPL